MRFLSLWKKSGPKAPKKSLLDRINGVPRKELQDRDMTQIRKTEKLAAGLNIAPLHTSHPLRPIALKLKSDLRKLEASSIQGLNAIESRVTKENSKHSAVYGSLVVDEISPESSDMSFWKFQTALRLDNLSRYLANLKASIENGEIDERNALSEETLSTLIDASLLGSGSERVSVHMRLYGPTFTQNQLQMSFYTLYNAEIDSVVHAVTSLPLEVIKDHRKALTKYAKTYLLDSLELNSKSRCVFAWADPKFVGFQPLDDDATMPAEQVLFSRQKYFEEGSEIAKLFIESYGKERRILYNDRDETYDNLRYGVVFLFGTILVDWFVCVM